MPRVMTQTKSNRGAERKCGTCGHVIEPGETYYKWSFRYGGTRYACSKHYPKRSQLTQSLMGEVYAAIEDAEADLPAAEDHEAVAELVTNVTEITDEIAQQYRDAAEPFGGEGESAERAEELEGWSSELGGFYADTDQPLEDVRGEAQELLGGCPI